jgi:hypothetical protein
VLGGGEAEVEQAGGIGRPAHMKVDLPRTLRDLKLQKRAAHLVPADKLRKGRLGILVGRQSKAVAGSGALWRGNRVAGDGCEQVSDLLEILVA